MRYVHIDLTDLTSYTAGLDFDLPTIGMSRETTGETHLPTKYNNTKASARISIANGNRGRAPGSGAQTGKEAQTSFRVNHGRRGCHARGFLPGLEDEAARDWRGA